ncbi:ATP-binding protein [Fusibacter sp. 3D3]|uniref:AlbA family DNA-binding domain-containing protein n=1 Tax=Fusibacter sp. 3D3 TaxID=1048380 RepID=UPI000A061ABA
MRSSSTIINIFYVAKHNVECNEKKYVANNTFLKTVSAYANYETGTIIFGVNDQGDAVGVDDIQETCANARVRLFF